MRWGLELYDGPGFTSDSCWWWWFGVIGAVLNTCMLLFEAEDRFASYLIMFWLELSWAVLG